RMADNCGPKTMNRTARLSPFRCRSGKPLRPDRHQPQRIGDDDECPIAEVMGWMQAAGFAAVSLPLMQENLAPDTGLRSYLGGRGPVRSARDRPGASGDAMLSGRVASMS